MPVSAMCKTAVSTAPVSPVSPGHAQAVSLLEILSALSYALDLTEDAVPGHALRCCLLGMRIADELRLEPARKPDLFYALLLKDVGCSNNASRMYQIIGGDDRKIKTRIKLEDWTQPHKPSLSAIRLLWKTVLPSARIDQKIGRILRIVTAQHRNNREMISLRCDRGAEIVRKLGLGEATAEAIRCLDEHWDGKGYPEHRTHQKVPLLSRIVAVAQHLDVFSTERSPEHAMRVLQKRSGKWFDPAIVKAVMLLEQRGELWPGCLASRQALNTSGQHSVDDQATLQSVLALDPEPHRKLAASEIDNICAAFAGVVDAKSPFTFRHSKGVTQVADDMARVMGLSEDRRHLVHRAALLHDIGKLRVPNTILDKPGLLTIEERSVMEEHPALTAQILGRVAAFEEVARVAGAHHERLDGSGYPDRLTGAELSLEARLLAVADVFSALTEDRPYRKPLSLDRVIHLMQEQVPRKLDARCFEALIATLADAADSEVSHPLIHAPRTPTWSSLRPATRPAAHLA